MYKHNSGTLGFMALKLDMSKTYDRVVRDCQNWMSLFFGVSNVKSSLILLYTHKKKKKKTKYIHIND